ncbi:MAG: DUF2798 domain-containing protein [Pseudomonadota bacterium]
MRLPAKFAPFLFGLLLSGFMSFLVSGVATVKALGFAPELFSAWMNAWAFSWVVAFPVVLVVAPLVRRLVARITE